MIMTSWLMAGMRTSYGRENYYFSEPSLEKMQLPMIELTGERMNEESKVDRGYGGSGRRKQRIVVVERI